MPGNPLGMVALALAGAARRGARIPEGVEKWGMRGEGGEGMTGRGGFWFGICRRRRDIKGGGDAGARFGERLRSKGLT